MQAVPPYNPRHGEPAGGKWFGLQKHMHEYVQMCKAEEHDSIVTVAWHKKKGGGSPYMANETSVWDVITSVVGVVRRVLSFALNYTRFTLIFVWYFVIVWGWEQLCWENSCTAVVHTSCHIKMSTFACKSTARARHNS